MDKIITFNASALSILYSWHSQQALTRKRCWFRRHRLRILCFSGAGSPWRSASSHRLSFERSDSDSPAPLGRCWPDRRLWRTCRWRWSWPRCFSSTRAWSCLIPPTRLDASNPRSCTFRPICGHCSRVLSSASAPPKWLAASWSGRGKRTLRWRHAKQWKPENHVLLFNATQHGVDVHVRSVLFRLLLWHRLLILTHLWKMRGEAVTCRQ